MGCLTFEKFTWFFVFLEICFVPICYGDTDPRDVYAINSLYASLGYPSLPGWLPVGGDPCGQSWQGVQCVNSNVTGLVLSGANLGGRLTEDLGVFASIIQIDLSSNQIGGGIPLNLPTTLQHFYLSGNLLTGIIPDTVASLGLLTDLSLNDNQLIGVVPDVFQQLPTLQNLDLSGNHLTGQLPASMGNLASLNILHLQNNQLSGTLNVLQDLPLRDLNIMNNLFSGPIPDKLLAIPSFSRAGNPFNTTVMPSPPAVSPSLPPSGTPGPEAAPRGQGTLPLPPPVLFDSVEPSRQTKGISWIVVGGVVLLIVFALGLCLLVSLCCKRRKTSKKVAKNHEMCEVSERKENPKPGQSLDKPLHQTEKVPKEVVSRPAIGDMKDHRRNNLVSTSESLQGKDNNRKTTLLKNQKEHKIDISSEFEADSLVPPPPPPFPINSGDGLVSDPILPLMTSRRPAMKSVNSVNFFTIASLQQRTNSFSQENFIGSGMLGSVYKAELLSGRLLAVKKLDTAVILQQSDEEFLELVSHISKLKHPNIVELVGYCVEHGQRLLIYEYCINGTLNEALHLDDQIHKSLSWNTRMRLALQAARAIEYLHEVCRPPVIYQNFKSANILLDDDLIVRVSDCGLAPLLPPNLTTQLQGQGYGAPELELGRYTHHSDVYSFGVVMLELLTGRKAYDRSRPRGEQSLVRWAIPRLHDIDALSKMVDASLNGAYPSKSLSRFADIISLCIQREPEFRPPISEIVQNLLHMVH
ncbi:hypothetical protein Leryth_024011 [Lithospermum erythrorhizon]|nr:hypothetical protein Leryth_024011 [Lithospermum erythrorhizon]